MRWNLRYAVKSYLLSAIWTAPVVAFVLEQVTFRIAYVRDLDFGGIPGFVLRRLWRPIPNSSNIRVTVALFGKRGDDCARATHI
jgi:hypothetical protein